MACPSMRCALLTPTNAISRASAAPLIDLPRGTLARALDLVRPMTSVTPYHREIYRALLTNVLAVENASEVPYIERELAAVYGSNFSDYGWRGARLAVLLARRTPVAQFALSLANSLEEQRIDLSTLASSSEEELFPELFANSSLSEAQRQYLEGQLDNEYEVAFTRFARLILRSVQPSQIPVYRDEVEPEICWEQDQSYCYELVALLERLAMGDETNPYNGQPISSTIVTGIRQRYSAQLLLMRRYIQLRG